MGNYISSSELEVRVTSLRLDQLAQVEGMEKASFLGQVITRAEQYADAFMTEKYTVPIPPSGMIKEIVMRIAEYELYKRGSGGDVPIKYKTSYDEARKDLTDINKGAMIPPNTTDQSLAAKDTVGSSIDVDSDTAFYTEAEANTYF